MILVEQLMPQLPQVEALVVCTLEGDVLASAGTREEALRPLLSMVVGIRHLSERMCEASGMGESLQLIVRGSLGHVSVTQLSEEELVILQSVAGAPLGAVIADANLCVTTLRRASLAGAA
jgi:predicted regulator of Ras-like GTPase activity (Roadblock/LC7/MglB family)